MHRILSVYSSDIFHISDNFFEICFEREDFSEETPQVTHAVKKLIAICSGEMDRAELQEKVGLSDRKSFTKNYLNPAIEQGLIEMTIPEKPKSRLQKYRLTGAGKYFLEAMQGQKN